MTTVSFSSQSTEQTKDRQIRTHAHNEKVEFDRGIEKQNEKTGNNACAECVFALRKSEK